MAKVYCKCHHIKYEKEDLFKVDLVLYGKKVNEYYCSEKIYKEIKEDKEYRTKVIEILESVFGRKIINTQLNKELKIISEIHTYKKIFKYIEEDKQKLINAMTKTFISEYAEIRYLAAILKNNLSDFKIVDEIKKENIETDFIPVTTNTRYKKKETKKRSMLDIMKDKED